MPTYDGRGFDNDQGVSPPGPDALESDPEGAICDTDRRTTPLRELLPGFGSGIGPLTVRGSVTGAGLTTLTGELTGSLVNTPASGMMEPAAGKALKILWLSLASARAEYSGSWPDGLCRSSARLRRESWAFRPDRRSKLRGRRD